MGETHDTTGNWSAESISPYVHWRRTLAGGVDDSFVEKGVGFDSSILPPDPVADVVHPMYGGGEIVPVPDGVQNPETGQLNSLVPDNIASLVPNVPPRDAVIVGIIDEAIALGHPRFRDANGRSRVLASWQQGATFDVSQKGYLPFGNELYQSDLDALLQRFSDGQTLTRSLDEVAFNRAAKLSEPLKPYGVRALDHRAGHGTSALDLAAGEEAHLVTPEHLARRPILAATLPRRYAIGMAGAYLEFFAIYAMHRMVALADAIWAAHYGADGGYPIVLNVSYGQQAGAKDGSSLFERAAKRLIDSRPDSAPLRVVMPVGNDNLMRCNALRKLRRNGKFREFWRLLPQDKSSNFVEVWTGASCLKSDRHPLDIKVCTPQKQMAPWCGRHGEYLDIDGGGRIYCQRVRNGKRNGKPVYRYRYVICVPPTAEDGLPHGTARMAPAGLWKIQVHNRHRDLDVFMNIQIDQAAEPGKSGNHRSYFENSEYQTHLPNGRVCDSFAYPIDPANPDLADQEDRRSFGHVQRKGTVNSLANSDAICVIGAYRTSDGAPSDYSATSYQRHYGAGGIDQITASFPGDDGATLPGLLTAGTQAGSVVSARGTSFAAARATRWIVDQMLQDPQSGTPEQLSAEAKRQERRNGRWLGAAHPLKVGHGRMEDLRSDRIVSRQ